MKPWFLCIIFAILALGCAGPQTLLVRAMLSEDISPPPAKGPGPPAEGRKVTVSLAPIIDVRGEKISIGTRTRFEGVVDTYAAEGGLSEAVTLAVESWLKKAGYGVERAPLWDLKPESLKAFSTDLVLGGKIEDFRVETQSRFAKTETRVACALSIIIGKTRDSSVTTEKIETTAENQSPFFSLESVEETMSEALTEAITRALKRLP